MRLGAIVGAVCIAAAAAWWFLRKGDSRAAGGASMPGSSSGGVLEDIGQAILQYEGGKPGNRNVKNNNPGNLKSASGMTGTAGGFATFGDEGDGWDALYSWIKRHAADHPDWNFYDLFGYYLRGSTTAKAVDKQGDSNAYAEYVANYAGLDPTQSVESALED
jgi:hypothetical protein